MVTPLGLVQNGPCATFGVFCGMWSHRRRAGTRADRSLQHWIQHFAGRAVSTPIGRAELPAVSDGRLRRSAGSVRCCARGAPELKRGRGGRCPRVATHRGNDSSGRLRESDDGVGDVPDLLTYQGDHTGPNRICLGPTDEVGLFRSNHGNKRIDALIRRRETDTYRRFGERRRAKSLWKGQHSILWVVQLKR